MPPPAHRVTTAHLQAAYPFQSEGGLADGRGVYVGRDLFGGSFVFDPWVLYEARAITSPNALVIGQIGRGKSSLVKTLVWRSLPFGRRAVILDPKGEYGALAGVCGVRPIRVEPGGEARLNPLDAGPTASLRPAGQVARERLALLQSLAGASLGRALVPEERAALERALIDVIGEDLPEPTLPDVVRALLHPSPRAAEAVATDPDSLARASREVALELRRLCEGDLRGMFDGATTVHVDLSAPVLLLDLSAVYRSEALGLLMTCAAAWLQALLAGPEPVRRLVVVDEAWAILQSLEIARWLQSSFKLSRAFGVANLAVLHRVSDLLAAGSGGSQQVRLAQGLLADTEVRVIYAQSPGEAAAARELLALTRAECELLPHLRSGVALWKVGHRSFLVEHRVGSLEVPLVDTDARMALDAEDGP
jgi:type IV secretory pathway VirB4 component